MSEERECKRGSEGELINLLMEEYRTLREEQVSKLSSQANLLGFAGATVAVAASFAHGWTGSLVTIGIVIIMAMGYYVRNIQNVLRLSRQLALLEGRINRLATTAYGTTEPALTWLTHMRQAGPGLYGFLIRRGF